MTQLTRRDFLVTTAASIAATRTAFAAASTNAFAGQLCFFSKHLPSQNWQQLAQSVKQLGCDGVDLTVRPGGHVTPEKAATELPQAVAAIRAAGLSVPMITTGLLTADEPTAPIILAAAGKAGIPYFKTGYHKYGLNDARAEIAKAGAAFRSIAALGKQHNVQAGFHNHTGYIGGGIWDFMPVMDALESQWGGWYYDPHHAVAEGGGGAWKAALNIIARRIKMVAVKDFTWEKGPKGWAVKDCPLGQGMVDWPYFFAALAKANFKGPISLHIEYDIAGKTASEKETNTLVAAERDLAFLKAQVAAAFR